MRRRESVKGKMLAIVFDKYDNIMWVIENSKIIYSGWNPSDWSIKKISEYPDADYALIGYGRGSSEFVTMMRKRRSRELNQKLPEWQREEIKRERGRKLSKLLRDLRTKYDSEVRQQERLRNDVSKYRRVNLTKLARGLLTFCDNDLEQLTIGKVSTFLRQAGFAEDFNIERQLEDYARGLYRETSGVNELAFNETHEINRKQAEESLASNLKEKRYQPSAFRNYTYIDKSGYKVDLSKFLIKLGNQIKEIPEEVGKKLEEVIETYNILVLSGIGKLQMLSREKNWDEVKTISENLTELSYELDRLNVRKLGNPQTYTPEAGRNYYTESGALLELERFEDYMRSPRCDKLRK